MNKNIDNNLYSKKNVSLNCSTCNTLYLKDNGTSEKIPFNKLAVSRKIIKENCEIFKKRAKAKYITFGYIFDLINLNSPLKTSYKNTVHCCSELIYDIEKNKITGKYCKNRWCLVCNRIRTGKLINRYLDELSKYKDLYFVTLTIRNVKGIDLKHALTSMQAEWSKLRFRYKKQNISFNGIRKSECTYNLRRQDYHPHYHIIIQGKTQANNLLADWLKLYPDITNIKGQDVRKADVNTLKELFKYTTKIVIRDKNTPKNVYRILVEQLDVMNQAYYQKKVFIPFGDFRKIKINDDIDDIQSENLESQFEGSLWEWVQSQSDWVSEYGEFLTENEYYKKLKVITK
jgi:hypothetical protein